MDFKFPEFIQCDLQNKLSVKLYNIEVINNLEA